MNGFDLSFFVFHQQVGDDGVQFSNLYKGMMSTHHVYSALQVGSHS